ncbi:MAG: branched-chain amino acid ABC transporter permease [Azospirillaceae bacterium]
MIGRRGAFALVALLLAAAPLVLGEGYYLHLMIMFAIFAIAAASLDLIVGVAGLLSLGHAAFFGLGAYTSALLFLHAGLPMFGGMLAGALVAAIAAALLGALILKVRGHRFVITTVAFAEIMRLVAYNWVDLTRGQMGLPGVLAPRIPVPGLGVIDFNTKTAFYYLALVVAGVCVFALRRIADGPAGRGFAALRENEPLAESVGISTYHHAIAAFTIGAFFAGISGSLYAHYISFVGPDLFYFSYTTLFLVMVVIGGKGTIWGPVMGAFAFTLLPELLRVADEFRLVFFGGLLIVAVLFFPRGLTAGIDHLSRRFGRAPDATVERRADA